MKALQGSEVILSFAPVCVVVCLCLFLMCVVHGSGAFILTCGCGWGTVSLERATGETIVTGSVVEESWQQQKRSNS